MGLFDCFPLSNAYSVNLDWILREIRGIEKYVEDYTAVNKVSYAGVWDITKQYPKWSVVSSGDSVYLSLLPVPSGVPLENTVYWQKLADLDPRIAGIITESEKLAEYAISNPRIDVTKHGIVGDGVTDNSTAFAALNVDGNMLYFPAGKYKFSTRVDVGNLDILFSPNAILDVAFMVTGRAKFSGGQFSNSETVFAVNGTSFTLENAVLTNSSEHDCMIAIFQGSSSIKSCNFNGGDRVHFCVWSDIQNSDVNLHIDNCRFSNVFLNAIFSNAAGNVITNCYFTKCHKQTTPSGGGCIDIINSGNALIQGCYFGDFYSLTSGIETERSGFITAISNIIDNSAGNYGIALQNGGSCVLINNRILSDIAVYTDNASSVSGFHNVFTGEQAPYEIHNPYAKCMLYETDFKGRQVYTRSGNAYMPLFPISTMSNVVEIATLANASHLYYSFRDGAQIRVKIGDGTEFIALLHSDSVKIIGDNGNVGLSASNSLLDIVNNGAQTTFEVYYL